MKTFLILSAVWPAAGKFLIPGLLVATAVLVIVMLTRWALQPRRASMPVSSASAPGLDFADLTPEQMVAMMREQKRPLKELEFAWETYGGQWIRWDGRVLAITQHLVVISVHERDGVHLKALIDIGTVRPTVLASLSRGEGVSFEAQLPRALPWKGHCGFDEYLRNARLVAVEAPVMASGFASHPVESDGSRALLAR